METRAQIFSISQDSITVAEVPARSYLRQCFGRSSRCICLWRYASFSLDRRFSHLWAPYRTKQTVQDYAPCCQHTIYSATRYHNRYIRTAHGVFVGIQTIRSTHYFPDFAFVERDKGAIPAARIYREVSQSSVSFISNSLR